MQLDVSQVLSEVFGHARFRPMQEQAAGELLAGRDVLLVLPTGGGKSLCYQAPAVALARAGQGPTLVVSPLIALMDDQVAALRARRVQAAALHSGIPWAEQRAVLTDLLSLELLYVSPERLRNQRFFELLKRARFARAAIDEAHCISEWGHDFRPEYRQLACLKRELQLPVMATTATATPRVRQDIAASLQLQQPVCLVGSSARDNLRFFVHHPRKGQTRTAWVTELLTARGFAQRATEGHALVYAATRARAQAVQRALRKAGIRAGYYHAGRNDSARARAHAMFESGKTPVMVATSAYGMGIDIASVRLVLHVEAPGSLEAYVQQAGRAGRDGRMAECWLGFSPADSRIHARLNKGKAQGAFESLAAYAVSDECRQRLVAAHFGELNAPTCGQCDVCSDADAVRSARALALSTKSQPKSVQASESKALPPALSERELELVVAFVDAMPKPVGRRAVVKALRGSKARDVVKKRLTSNPHHAALSESSEEALFAAVDELLKRGLLVPKGQKYPTLWVAGKAVRTKRVAGSAREPSNPLEAALKRYRRAEAKRRRIKAYQVFQNRTLKQLCELRPQNEQQLLAVWGFGDERVRKYGSDLLALFARLEKR